MEGATVTWDFADFPGAFPVHVRKVVPNRSIVLEWQAGDGKYDTRVEMSFEALDSESSKVQIAESGWKETQAGLDASYGNCYGWMHMLCCLKVWLERGINLREYFSQVDLQPFRSCSASSAACLPEIAAFTTPEGPTQWPAWYSPGRKATRCLQRSGFLYPQPTGAPRSLSV